MEMSRAAAVGGDGYKGDHHTVYVVRLDGAVPEDQKFRDANPQYREGKPCVYVGMTGLTPDSRFKNHRRGHKSNRYVKRYGKYLMRSKFQKLNPMSYEQAQKVEEDLAEQLRRKGYAAWQN
jgi:hypothetical protein